MPWSDGPGAGFTEGRPWLRIGSDSATRNVASQLDDAGSVLALYRRLTALRAELPALQVGAFELLPSAGTNVVAYIRTSADQTLLIVINLARDATSWPVADPPSGSCWRTALTTSGRATATDRLVAGQELVLAADEARILRAVADD